MRFNVALVIALFSIIMMSSTVFAHGTNSGNADHHARVGELFPIEGNFETKEQGPFEVRFRAVRLEDGADILSMKGLSTDGSYRFAMQFFDGAEHEVILTLVDPKTKAVVAVKKMLVEVEGFHPPMFIKMKTMAFILSLIVIGMGLGVGLTRLKKGYRPLEGGHLHVQ